MIGAMFWAMSSAIDDVLRMLVGVVDGMPPLNAYGIVDQAAHDGDALDDLGDRLARSAGRSRRASAALAGQRISPPAFGDISPLAKERST